jgi:hypothetical protein
MAHGLDLTHANTGFGSLQVTENDVISTSIDLFSPPSREVTMIGGCAVTVLPLVLSDDGPIEFIIPSMGTKFWKSNLTTLSGVTQIVKADGTHLADSKGQREVEIDDPANAGQKKKVMETYTIPAVDYTVVNNFSAALFKSIEMEYDGKLISELSSSHVSYKSTIETLLSYGTDAAKSHLQSSFWFPDDQKRAAAFGKGLAADKVNNAYITRYNFTLKSRRFDWDMAVPHDLLRTDRDFPPGKSWKIRFNRAPDAFSIIAPDTTTDALKVKILDLKLNLHYVEYQDNVRSHILHRYLSEPACYPIQRTDIKNYFIETGATSFVKQGMFTGILPRSILIAMVRTDAFNGRQNLNPFVFEMFDISDSELKINGEVVQSYKFDMKSEHAIKAFSNLFKHIGINGEDRGIGITYAGFLTDHFLLPFDLSPDRCNG